MRIDVDAIYRHVLAREVQSLPGLELHTSLLRTLGKAQEQLRAIAPRSHEGGLPR